jgi:hypothetical protein
MMAVVEFFSRKIRAYQASLLSLLLFLLALFPRITTLDRTFIVNDETLYWSWTNEFITALLNFDWAGTLVGKGYPAVTIFWVHGLGLVGQTIVDLSRGYALSDMGSRTGLDQPFILALLWQRRLVMAVMNAWLISLIFGQARKLLGRPVALLGTVLLIFAPFLLADARTMRGDALLSSLMLLSLLALLNFLRRGRHSALILSGVTLGLAILTKITALPLFGIGLGAIGAALLYRSGWAWPRQWRWGLAVLAAWAGLAGLTIFSLWPALWVAPMEVLTFIRGHAEGSLDGRLNYFWGRLTYAEPLHLFYPNAFLFRATPLVVLGTVVSGGLMVAGFYRRWRHRLTWSQIFRELWGLPPAAGWTLLALSGYALLYGLALDVGALKRDRYLMPVFPALMFVAAAGLLWLVGAARRRWPGPDRFRILAGGRWLWLILGLGLAWEVGQVWSTHPFYYTYWNPLMGGGAVAARAMMAESGVESSALVALSQTPSGPNETVAVLFTRDFAPAFSGEVVRLANHTAWVTADHILLRQYHMQTEKLEPALLAYLAHRPLERVIEFQGYPWGWLYAGPAAQFFSGSLLEGKARLLGYDLSDSRASTASPLQLKLIWQNQGRQPEEQIFVRLVDAAGFIWAESLARPRPEFAAAAGLVEAIVESEASLVIPPGTPPGLYYLKIGLAGETELGEFVLPGEGSAIVVEPTPGPVAEPALSHMVRRPIGPDLTLLGLEIEPELLLNPPTPARLTLYWRAETDITTDYQLRLALIDQNGQPAGLWSGPPARGIYPTTGWPAGALVRDPWRLEPAGLAPAIAPGDYTLTLTLVETATAQPLGQVTLTELEVIERRRLFSRPPLETRLDARFGQAITLLGYNLKQAPLTGGARFEVELFWQTHQPLSTNYTVFVQMLGPDGTVLGQHDGMPVGGTVPTSAWAVAEIISDRHRLEFPTGQPGSYRLIVGLYEATSEARLPLAGPAPAPAADFLEIYTFTVAAEG